MSDLPKPPPVPVPHAPSKEMMPFPILFLEAAVPLKVSVYLKSESKKNIIMVRKKGEQLSLSEALYLKKRPPGEVFAVRDEYDEAVQHVAQLILNWENPHGKNIEQIKKMAAVTIRSMAAHQDGSLSDALDLSKALFLQTSYVLSSVLLEFGALKNKEKSYRDFIQGIPREASLISNHHKMVATIAALMCLTLENFSEQDISDVVFAGLVHDLCLEELPKVFMERHLNGEDFKPHFTAVFTPQILLHQQKQHSELAVQRLLEMGIPLTEGVIQCILMHHEQNDGSGPHGKKGFEIYRPARVLRIADDLVCLIHSPKHTWSLDEALDEMMRYNSTGSHRVYDPDVLQALYRAMYEVPVDTAEFWEQIMRYEMRGGASRRESAQNPNNAVNEPQGDGSNE